MVIRLIATGGTFDKSYDPLAGRLTFENTHLPEILETSRIADPVELEIEELVDSLEMGEDRRMAIVESCRRSPESHIVVVHGTDTMTLTARLIGRAALEKTVVLTGAMIPYAVARSDALFNLGSAFMAARVLPYGVWIVMNGRALPWNEAVKDRERGIFRPEST